MRTRLFLMLAVALVGAASIGIRAEQQGQGGMISAEAAALDIQVVEPAVDPANVFGNANFQSGGTGMRNQKRGGIMINGVVPGGVTPITYAVVYWALITSTSAPLTTVQRKITVSRQWPTTTTKPANASFIGSEIAATASPCWGGTTLHVLKAVVTSVVTGNGLYRVQVYAGGSFAGGDPWNSPAVFPLQEGASLVVVYPQSGPTTAIYDGPGLSTMFGGSLTYTLALPFTTSVVKIDFANADGQIGSGRAPGAAGETTTINGVHVGNGSPWAHSLWDGAAGWPLPQLWDNAGRVLSLSSTSALTVTHTSAGGDCLVPVANVVSNAGV